MKINRLQLNAAFRNHITGYRTVDPSRQQKHRTAVCSDRHSSRTRNDLGININFFSYLYIQTYFRIVHINFHLRICIKNRLAKRTV